jgi:molecular chaperone GrpE
VANDDKKDEVVDLSDFDATSETPAPNPEVEQLKKDYLYLRADFDNYKKSAIKERSDLIRYGTEPLLQQLLVLLDTFDQALALEINSTNVDSFREGIEMLHSEFNNTLSKFGVKAIESEGVAFDPSIHEAITSEPTDAVPDGHISRVLKKAYKLHDRVIRPAQVVVATAPEKKE